MKKLLALCFVVLLFPLSAGAMVDSDVWSYVFHLEYSQGKLQVSPDAKFPYSPVPMEFVPEFPSDQTDFYGIIYNVKNKEEARFGFMLPTTANLASGKSVMEIAAPKFADADHVSFYTKANKHLFDISVKDSSFCNDNNKCDATYGEDYKNCPADCPAPMESSPTPEPIMTPTPTPTASEPVVVPQPNNSYATSVDTSYVTTSTVETVAQKKGIGLETILSFMGGIVFFVLAFIFYRRKKAESVI